MMVNNPPLKMKDTDSFDWLQEREGFSIAQKRALSFSNQILSNVSSVCAVCTQTKQVKVAAQ
jgi:hypothetical protein